MDQVTGWLRAWESGDAKALEQLLPAVYPQLRRLARRELSRERPHHTLQTADLISELYLRLVDQHQARWQNRAQFFAICARLLRRILVDHARRKHAGKRGAGQQRVSIELAEAVPAGIRGHDVIALDQALSALGELDPRKAQVVEMRFFGGLSIEDCAHALGCSHATVEREWRAAKAWLFRKLRSAPV